MPKKNMKKNVEEDFDLDEANKEIEESFAYFKKVEEEGLKNLAKHFDRIHDKLFTFNNFLITGYLAIAKFDGSVPIKSILFPIANMVFLILIEYRMMISSRIQSFITEVPAPHISKWKKATHLTNFYSFLIIFSTLLVTGVFLYYLF